MAFKWNFHAPIKQRRVYFSVVFVRCWNQVLICQFVDAMKQQPTCYTFLCVNHERQDVSKTSKFFFSKWVTATGSFFPFLIQSRFSSQTAPIVNGVTTNKNLFSLGRFQPGFQLKYFTRNDLFPLRFQIIALTGIYTGYLTFQHCHFTFETCINFEVFKPRYL